MIGLKTIAITDHDTVRGVREALPIAAHYGVTLISGIEMTCRWDESDAPPGDTDVDVLGYYIDYDEAQFRAVQETACADMTERMEMCCALLTADGYAVTIDEVFAQNSHYAGTVPLLKALQQKGYAGHWREAVALIDTCWRRVRPSVLHIDAVIAAIHAAGGVAVLAHPSLISWKGGRLDAAGLASLINMGLDGIEIYHPSMPVDAREHFLALARQFDLLITGGSDEHGWPTGFPRLGCETATQEMLDALAARAEGFARCVNELT